jgi:capsular exopolysaccharide synthesis family protein
MVDDGSFDRDDEPRRGTWDGGPGVLHAVGQYRWLVGLLTALAVALGVGVSLLQTPMYEAEAQVLLADPRNAGVFRDGQSQTDVSRYVRNEAQFMRTSTVAAGAVELIDGRVSVADMPALVSTHPSADLDLIVVRALDPDPDGAAELANAVVQAYHDRVGEEVRANAEAVIAQLAESRGELEQRIAAAERAMGAGQDTALAAERDAAVAQLITIEGRANQIAVDAALFGAGVKHVEAAIAPTTPARPRPLRNAVGAGLLGLFAAAGFAWWRAEQTQRADRRQDPAMVLGAPMLGEVPDFATVGVDGVAPAESAPTSVAAEAYQFIVSALTFALQHDQGTSVLLTSAGPSDGKTTTALNLAIAAARDGRKVLLVDADQRVQGLTRLAGTEQHSGLTDLADASLPFSTCVWWRVGAEAKLRFVPAGNPVPDTAGFFRTAAFRIAMNRVKAEADFVIVDSPPLLAVSDTSAIASQVDGVVIIVTRGTPLKQLEDVRQRLAFIGTPVLGYVFNRGQPRSGYYGYGYGYGGSGADERSGAGSSRSRWLRRRVRASG